MKQKCNYENKEYESNYLVRTTDGRKVNNQAYHVTSHALCKGLVSLVEVQAIHTMYDLEKELLNSIIVILRKHKYRVQASDNKLITMLYDLLNTQAIDTMNKTLQCTTLPEHIQLLQRQKQILSNIMGLEGELSEGNSSREKIRKAYLEKQRANTDRKVNKLVYPYW